MNARILFAVAVLTGLGGNGAAAAEAQKPPLVYEVTIDGETYEISDSVTVELMIQGKRVQAMIRLKPIQHYATDTVEFDYEKSLSLRDDFDKEGRSVTLVHGSTASIVIGDLGRADADGPKAMLGRLADQMETRFQRGVCKDLRKTLPTPVRFKQSSGYTTTLTYKDEDDDQQTCRIYALEGKGRRFSVILQYDAAEREVAESLARPTLDSVTGRTPGQRLTPATEESAR